MSRLSACIPCSCLLSACSDQGTGVADGRDFPNWNHNSEFRAKCDESSAQRALLMQ